MQGDDDNAVSANNKDCNMQSQAVGQGQSKISRLDIVLNVQCFSAVLPAAATASGSLGQALSDMQSGQQSPSVDVGWQQWVAPPLWVQA